MQSTTFIKAAGELLDRVHSVQGLIDTPDRLRELRESTQRDVSALFNGLQNPTLPSAFNLRDAAMRAGFTVPIHAAQRMSQFENWSA